MGFMSLWMRCNGCLYDKGLLFAFVAFCVAIDLAMSALSSNGIGGVTPSPLDNHSKTTNQNDNTKQPFQVKKIYELVKQGVLEEAPNGGDYPAWDVNYTITLTENHNIELSIEEQPSLSQWVVHVGYSKWKDGCAYPPRAAKIIWDDFNRFLPEIDGEMAITNQSEIISKMALLTINREG